MKIRANRFAVGKYVEVDVVPVPEEENSSLVVRGKKKRGYVTSPEKQISNDRRTFKYLRMVIQGNFEKDDYYMTLTFKMAEIPLPNEVDVAKKHLGNFLDKIRRRYKKAGLECKYVWVMEYELDDQGEYMTKVHFHVILNKGISRDEIEDCWSIGNGKNRRSLGLINTKRIRVNGDTKLEDLAEYFAKGVRTKKGKKAWNSSRNLQRPYKTSNDHKFSRRQLEKMAVSNDEGRPLIEKKYPDYRITDIKYRYTDYRGWHLYLRMWKEEEDGG